MTTKNDNTREQQALRELKQLISWEDPQPGEPADTFEYLVDQGILSVTQNVAEMLSDLAEPSLTNRTTDWPAEALSNAAAGSQGSSGRGGAGQSCRRDQAGQGVRPGGVGALTPLGPRHGAAGGHWLRLVAPFWYDLDIALKPRNIHGRLTSRIHSGA